jgi:hypothetical protein
MNLNKHLEIKGKHALFSPSQPSWLNYDADAVTNRLDNRHRKDLGTCIHEYAATEVELGHSFGATKYVIDGVESYIYNQIVNPSLVYRQIADTGLPVTVVSRDALIAYGQQLLDSLRTIPKETWETVKSYINDSSSFKMIPEQPFKYSDYIFGTADAFSFRSNQLRIHDLKTGSGPTHMEQLLCYAALFCLEYEKDPKSMEIELRIYQNNEIILFNPTIDDMNAVIKQITEVNKTCSKRTHNVRSK